MSAIVRELFAMNSSSSSSSESENEEENVPAAKKPKSERQTIQIMYSEYSDITFQTNFRMSRSTVEAIIKDLSESWNQTKGRPTVTFEKSLLITLWYLGNMETYRELGERFNLGKGNIHRIILKMCAFIHEKRKNYIQWPRAYKLQRTMEKFNSLHGEKSFPGVVGCINNLHITITGPRLDDSYCNQNGDYAIQAQATCNSDLQFTDVYIGWPGSAPVSKVWDHSPLSKLFRERKALESDQHIVGNSGYSIAPYMMVPYIDDGRLTNSQKVFNMRLNITRNCVDHAFGKLKSTFRRLQRLEIFKLENVKYTIMACFVLHNIILIHKDPASFYCDVSNDIIPNSHEFAHDETSQEYIDGYNKREDLCRQISD